DGDFISSRHRPLTLAALYERRINLSGGQTAATTSKSRLERRNRDCFLGLVFPFAELLDHFSIECRDVVRFAAGDQPIIDDDLFVNPLAAGVLDVGLDRRPRSKRSPANYASIDQNPGPVTNHGHWFARFEEMT